MVSGSGFENVANWGSAGKFVNIWAGGAAWLDCFLGSLFLLFKTGSGILFTDFFVAIDIFDFFDFSVFLDFSVLPPLEPFLLPSFNYLTLLCYCNAFFGFFTGLFMGLLPYFAIGNFTRRYVADWGPGTFWFCRGRRVTSWLDYILSEQITYKSDLLISCVVNIIGSSLSGTTNEDSRCTGISDIVCNSPIWRGSFSGRTIKLCDPTICLTCIWSTASIDCAACLLWFRLRLPRLPTPWLLLVFEIWES